MEVPPGHRSLIALGSVVATVTTDDRSRCKGPSRHGAVGLNARQDRPPVIGSMAALARSSAALGHILMAANPASPNRVQPVWSAVHG